MELEIPGFGNVCIENLVLDVNGTIATDGILIPVVEGQIRKLEEFLNIYLLTANTHGMQTEIDKRLGTTAIIIKGEKEAEQKEAFVEELGAKCVVAIGNGANDALMLKKAALGIVVVGSEGAAMSSIMNADILAGDISDALDLLLNPKRLKATLRR